MDQNKDIGIGMINKKAHRAKLQLIGHTSIELRCAQFVYFQF